MSCVLPNLVEACIGMVLPRALWLRLRNVPVLRMLRLEEALFRTDRRSWFITNEWDGVQPAADALVLGISGRPEQMLHVEAAQHSGVPVIKRFTGGGTVVVDSDTLFASFIVAEGALPHVKPRDVLIVLRLLCC